jgi:hypothetical protein
MIAPLKTPDGKSGREENGSSPESQRSEATASTATTISADEIPGDTVELNQDGFPDAIKNKHYRLESDLVNDLEEYELLDEYKYITLNEEGVAYRTEMPSIFHEVAVGELKAIVLQQCGGQLLVQSNFEMNFPDGTSRYPDLAIWGEERVEGPASSTTETGSGSLIPQPKTKEVDEFGFEVQMNPHVIIEFSWTNKLTDEIAKFKKQMAEHMESLGTVNVGFLITAVPTRGTALPTKKNREIPICGFDVYEIRDTGSQALLETEPSLDYRIGVNDDEAITITDKELGRSSESSEVHRLTLGALLKSVLEQHKACKVIFGKQKE